MKPLRHRDFRLLIGGQLASNLGDWVDFLALAVLIAYVWNMGPGALAALAVVIAVPWIVVSPFSGVLADRWPKKAVMIGADLARALIVTGLIFAPNLAVLLVLVFLKTVFSTLFNPAEQATIRMTVPEDELYAANSVSQLVLQSTKVIGPALGGLLLTFASPRAAFGIDAVTFLCSAAILSRLGPIEGERAGEDEEHEVETGTRGFWHELREGIAYITSRQALLFAIFGFAAAIFLLLAFDSLSPLAFKELGVSRGLFGLAIGAIGLGGVLGALSVGRFAGDVNPFVLMGSASVIIGGLVALMGAALLTNFDAPPFVWTPVLLVVGFASAGVLISSPTIFQRETPPELMGRVSASAATIPTVCQLAGPIVGATVAKWQSVGFVFAAAGGGLAAVGGIIVLVRPPVGVGVPGAATVPDATAVESTNGGPVRAFVAGVMPAGSDEGEKGGKLADLTVLNEVGMNVDELPPEQREALGRLDQSEVEALASIRRKLNTEPDVAGHAMRASDGGIIW